MRRLWRKRQFNIRTFIISAIVFAVGGFLIQPVASTHAADETMVSTIGYAACGTIGSMTVSRIAVGVDGSVYALIDGGGDSLICKVSGTSSSTVLAGSTPGYADGTGAVAKFESLKDITGDSLGNLYVIDNYRIRKITSAGVVTTLAGSTQGYNDGAGAAAQFQDPSGIVLDAVGNIYVKDVNSIRKITPSNEVTTVLSGVPGRDLVRDTAGNFYFVSADGLKLQKVTPSGVVTVLAGSTFGYVNGNGSAAQFEGIDNVEIDSFGNIYTLDSLSRLRKVTPSGDVTTIVEGFGSWSHDGPSSEASFEFPMGIAADAMGNLYISELGSGNPIRKVTFPALPIDTSTPPGVDTQQPAAPNTGVESSRVIIPLISVVVLGMLAALMISIKCRRV